MSASLKFGMMEAGSPQARMAALFEFVTFWVGRRQPEFGETAERLLAHQLPMPLRQLYEFAGRWTRKGKTIEEGFRWHLFAEQDALLPLDDLQVAENGKLIFVAENQGVWDCRTLCEGDDPPVWCCDDQRMENGVWISIERPVGESLSKFLVSFVLQELVLGAPTWADSEELEEHFLADFENATPLWLNGPYVDGLRHNIYLWKNVLVGDFAGSVFFAARDKAGEAYLINLGQPDSEGDISQVTVSFDGKWILIARPDGSAQIVQLGDGPMGIDAPPSSLNFDDVLESIGDVVANEKLPSRKVHVVLTYSTGVSSPHEQLEDESVARQLFVRSLDCSNHESAKKLQSLFVLDWPG